MSLEQVAERFDRALPLEGETGSCTSSDAGNVGSVLALVGLPGSGKSLLARTLGEMTSSVVISTDFARLAVRKKKLILHKQC